jgi:hypothetical protein
MANLAIFESRDSWVPCWLVDSDGNDLPEDVALDGAIRCTSGVKKNAYMRFEQIMATEVASDASPLEIETAVIKAVEKKSSRGHEYVDGISLIVFVDYSGELTNLRKLAKDINNYDYEAIYLVGRVSDDFKDFVCVTLKNPADRHGPVSIKFNRKDGKADVAILDK